MKPKSISSNKVLGSPSGKSSKDIKEGDIKKCPDCKLEKCEAVNLSGEEGFLWSCECGYEELIFNSKSSGKQAEKQGSTMTGESLKKSPSMMFNLKSQPVSNPNVSLIGVQQMSNRSPPSDDVMSTGQIETKRFELRRVWMRKIEEDLINDNKLFNIFDTFDKQKWIPLAIHEKVIKRIQHEKVNSFLKNPHYIHGADVINDFLRRQKELEQQITDLKKELDNEVRLHWLHRNAKDDLKKSLASALDELKKKRESSSLLFKDMVRVIDEVMVDIEGVLPKEFEEQLGEINQRMKKVDVVKWSDVEEILSKVLNGKL